MFNKAWVSNSKSIKTLFGCGLEFESQFHSDGIFDYLSQTQLSVNYLGFGIFGPSGQSMKWFWYKVLHFEV